MAQITVLGIGNILLQDEGFGVRVVESLHARYRFPTDVQVLDGGTLGMELMRFLHGTDKLILLDAVSGHLPPGGVYEMRNEQVKAYFKEKVSMHELGIQDVLAALEVLERPIDEIVIFGIQPSELDIGLELSPLIAPRVPEVVDKVIAELQSWKVEVIDHAI